MKRILLPAVLLLACATAPAQTAMVKDTTLRTYPYSDPDPVARTSKIYPYYRYHGFTSTGEDMTWKMVVLENDYLRVKIFPEIGGKIWSVYDKKNSQELFYDNDVVKFRDIAMRGPWTSGGIEFNYGVIGHAPSCSAPVDYKVEKKADGSVSCYIGVQELLTRTRWMVEINLPKDAVWLRTRTLWHNYSGLFQPYYHWMNSGATVTDDLQLIYPGTYTIGHGGEVTPYPYDEGHDLSQYAGQAFGGAKSMHPGGTHKGYFGTYWPSTDTGMLHFANRDDKLGRKYFSWAQSDHGKIWKELLTDTRPQYVELQSGRLFNQNDVTSVETPYKQFLFSPYGTDEWNEYWLPFAGIGSADDMTLRAVASVKPVSEGSWKVGLFPLQPLRGELAVCSASGKKLLSRSVNLDAAVPFNETLTLSEAPALITIGGLRIWSSDSQDTDRPNVINPEFSMTSAQGYLKRAQYMAGMRDYRGAETMVDSALVIDPALVPALDLRAMLSYRRMDDAAAYADADKVLSIDEYDPWANYVGGLAALRMGKTYDALDRLELAALTAELRSAAHTKLAEIHFAEGDRELAADYVRKSLVGNMYNVTALQIQYQIDADPAVLDRIEGLDPVGHFAAAEKYLAGKMSAEELYSSIFEELKWQNYIEFAAFYHRLGLDSRAVRILDACPEKNALMAIWKAYLNNDAAGLASAENGGLDFVFPFREESCEPLQWAVRNGGGWQSRYLLAQLRDFLGHKAEALSLVEGLDPDYAVFHAYRATLDTDPAAARADLQKACTLDPQQWRYVRDLALNYYDAGDFKTAASVAGAYYAKHKENPHISDAYIKSLMAAGDFVKADKVISTMHVLPFEGQSGTHRMYKEIKLALARQCLDKRQYKQALRYVEQAREWPYRLGTGKPYDDLIDTSEEDALAAEISAHLR